jgi:hypothetical protein
VQDLRKDTEVEVFDPRDVSYEEDWKNVRFVFAMMEPVMITGIFLTLPEHCNLSEDIQQWRLTVTSNGM